jgi:hypothetical protein
MICPICGNERSVAGPSCPFCGVADEGPIDQTVKAFLHKIVNLEAGRPSLEVALNRCRQAVDDAILNKINVITLIHGYGSSGKGGVIKSECRAALEYLKSKKIINDYVAGEDFHTRSGRVRALLQRYSMLTRDRNLNRGNQGITLVILSWSAVYCPLAAITILQAMC